MSSKANTQHMKLINKLKRIEKYKDDSLCITVETWSHSKNDCRTDVKLWSHKQEEYIFFGHLMVDLERFINEERKEAGIFQERK